MSKKPFVTITAMRSILLVIFFCLTCFPSFAPSKDLSAYKFISQKFAVLNLTGTNAWAEVIEPVAGWPHQSSDLLPDPDLVFGSLANGFRYVLMENQSPKDRVSMHLYVQVGSMHESDNEQGLAHFTEHMLFNGSTNFKPGELVKYFQSIGMDFGPDANAHTGFNETVYDILLPKGHRESLAKGLAVMKDFAEGALLLQSEVDRERRVVLSEKRSRDSESYRTYVAMMDFKFPEAIISKRLPIGMEHVLKNANRKQFKAFYDTWYRPETMVLIMVGDFDTNEAIQLITENFSALSARAPPGRIPDLGQINHQGIKPFYHFEEESGNTTLSIEVLEKVSRKPDSFAQKKRRLLNDVADRIVQNRLSAMVRKPATPFTSAHSSSGVYLNQIKYAEITAESSPENWKKSLFLLEQTLRQALNFGFTPSELERVKKDFLSEFDMAVKKASTRNSRDLGRKIIWSLNSDRVFMSPKQRKERFSPFIKSLTLKNVHDAFKEAWAPEHRLVLLAGNAALTGKDLEPKLQIQRAYQQSFREKVSPPPEKKSITFPYLPEPEKEGRIVQTITIQDLGIVQVDFENGVRLNVKKTDFKADEVLFNLSFGSGKSAEPLDKPGLAVLSIKIVNESGLGALEKDEIDRALAGKNTEVFFSIGEDALFFKGKTVTNEIQLLFQLLYAHLMDPGFREDAYSLAMERSRQQYAALSSSIEGAMVLFGQNFLAGGDSRFGLPPYDKYKKLALDDVRSWISDSLKPESFEISVVGDLDVDSVIKLATKYFGSISRKPFGQRQRSSGSLEFPTNQSRAFSVTTKIPKGLVVVAYPTEDLWNISRTRRLSILADILADRLRETIREKMGSTYSPFAFNRPSRAYSGYGVLQAKISVAPEEASSVADTVKTIVSELVNNGVTKDELTRALEPTLTRIKDMRQKNDYWLYTVLNGSKSSPQQLDWSRSIVKDYASITKEDISKLAKRYLDNSKAATIIIKPK